MQHSTNYFDTFIEVAPDCPITEAEVPPYKKDKPTVASIQYDFLAGNPYKYSSDDVLFLTFAKRKGIPKKDHKAARAEFFSKGQPCFRASPLTKRYGWGVHSDGKGKIAIYAMESGDYKTFVSDNGLTRKKAMKSKR